MTEQPRAPDDTAITSRAELVWAIQQMAEVEHGVMCQYLFAAFSVKKANEPGITGAQSERARRWEHALMKVARQEMEHLALLNNLLIAIGAAPYFGRPNFPLTPDYYPLHIPFSLERFGASALARFVCFERPDEWQPGDCGFDARPMCQNYRLLPEVQAQLAARPPLPAPPFPLQFSTIQDLADEIETAIENPNDIPDLRNLFVGNAAGEPYQNFQFNFEMNIWEFPISDIRTARAALDLILRQGEGIDAIPGYTSHFCLLADVYQQLTTAPFDPGWPCVSNPSAQNVADPFAREVMAFFDYAYTTMLYMLASFYTYFRPESSDPSKLPSGVSAAFQETAFAPMMTMVLRPIGEVLARLPAGDDVHTAGARWFIDPADAPLTPTSDPAFFLGQDGRLGQMDTGIQHLYDDAPPALKPRLAFIGENIQRTTANFRRIVTTNQPVRRHKTRVRRTL